MSPAKRIEVIQKSAVSNLLFFAFPSSILRGLGIIGLLRRCFLFCLISLLWLHSCNTSPCRHIYVLLHKNSAYLLILQLQFCKNGIRLLGFDLNSAGYPVPTTNVGSKLCCNWSVSNLIRWCFVDGPHHCGRLLSSLSDDSIVYLTMSYLLIVMITADVSSRTCSRLGMFMLYLNHDTMMIVVYLAVGLSIWFMPFCSSPSRYVVRIESRPIRMSEVFALCKSQWSLIGLCQLCLHICKFANGSSFCRQLCLPLHSSACVDGNIFAGVLAMFPFSFSKNVSSSCVRMLGSCMIVAFLFLCDSVNGRFFLYNICMGDSSYIYKNVYFNVFYTF